MPTLELSASLLAANCLSIGQQVQTLLCKPFQIDRLHVDAMDGAWVPHLFPGALLCRALRDAGVSAPIDVHLMVDCVDAQVDACIEAQASTVWFHPSVMSSDQAIQNVLERLRQSGIKAGLVVDLQASWEDLRRWIDWVDDWLVLAVKPGRCGQSFDPRVFDTIAAMQAAFKAQGVLGRISVDGGVNASNAGALAALDVASLVVGSALFDHKGEASLEAYQSLKGVCDGR